MIKQLLRTRLPQNIVIFLRQITDLLATDKSRYFAQTRPINVNYLRGSLPKSVPLDFGLETTFAS